MKVKTKKERREWKEGENVKGREETTGENKWRGDKDVERIRQKTGVGGEGKWRKIKVKERSDRNRSGKAKEKENDHKINE